MLHSEKARLESPASVAAQARRRLASLSRSAGEFDAARYFRGTTDLGFYNIGTAVVRRLAAEIARAHQGVWTVDDALAFAEPLIEDRHLEAKGLAVEVVARYRRAFAPRLLRIWKRWLAGNHSANWATTDAICGALIGPLLLAHPGLIAQTAGWSSHRNMWVRRAAAVSMIASARRGLALDATYEIAMRLHVDGEDLIQKAVGWMLREAGKADPERLERHLREYGPAIPRTTVRYAIERFPLATRRALLAATRAGKAGGAGRAGKAGGAGKAGR